MISINGHMSVCCETCGHIMRINMSQCDFYDDSFYEDAPMGTRTYYSMNATVKCTCGTDISIDVSATEYPPGGFEKGPIVTVYGAEYYREPNVEIECFADEFCSRKRQYDASAEFREKILQLTDRGFELFVGSVFDSLGFNVTVTKRTRDGGFDFEAVGFEKGITTTIIGECKHYSSHRKVGDEIVRKIHDVQYQRNANTAMVVTSSTFSKDARILARQYGMTLWDLNDLFEYGKDLL